MSLLRSKATRVFFSDNGVLSDHTESMRTWGDPKLTFSWIASQDALYIGRTHKFNYTYVATSTINTTPGVMSMSYWDGAGWEPFTDLLDETSSFSASGFITWEEKSAWQKEKPSMITGLTSLTFEQELFWVKVTLSADSSASTAITAIKQLLSDDRLMSTIHPEILQYLPTTQTNFFPQHELAKDSIVNDLIMSGTISYEDQIKNPEDYILAASYKTISLILAPIPGDERIDVVKKEMASNYSMALRKSAASIDVDKDEILNETEKESALVSHLTR